MYLCANPDLKGGWQWCANMPWIVQLTFQAKLF